MKANDPFIKEFPDLNVTPISAAIMQSKSKDVIRVGSGVWLTSPLALHQVRFKLIGDNPQQTILRIPDEENFLELGMNIHIEIHDCTVVVGDKARFLFLDEECSGNIKLKNVTVLYENEFDALSEFYPVIESKVLPEKVRRVIELERCKLPYVFIHATKIKARYAIIGDIIKQESFIQMNQESNFKNCWLHHIRFVYDNQDLKTQRFLKFHQIKTIGGLVIQGNTRIHSLDVIKYQSNYKEKLDRMQEIKGIYLDIDHELFQLNTLLSMHHQIYPEYVLTLLPFSTGVMQFIFDGRLGLEDNVSSIAFCHMTDVEARFSDTTIPLFQEKSILIRGSIELVRTIDDSHWQTEQTVIKLDESDSTLIQIIHEQTGFVDAGIEPVTATNEQSIHRNALSELDAMIGLKSAKETIQKTVAVAKLNQERERRGIAVSQGLSLHTVFLGNAGVGKTTVARLYAKALYENGLLKKDNLHEVTSKDLIAGYVGQTRPLVHQVVMDSLDGVLFIDEAYSLGNKNDEFASQAVDQLIADMENYRERLVVILAGYTNQMKDLLKNANPGLRSRFTNMVMFEDYNEKELLQILSYQLRSMKAQPVNKNVLTLAKKGLIYLQRQFVAGKENAGNGRFVRNFVQSILVARDNRLATQDLISLQDDSLLKFNDLDVKKAVHEMKNQLSL